MPFHARADSDGDDNGEEGRDAREHGGREGRMRLGMNLLGLGGVFMLSADTWLGKEMIRIGDRHASSRPRR